MGEHSNVNSSFLPGLPSSMGWACSNPSEPCLLVSDIKVEAIHEHNTLVQDMWLFPKNPEDCCIYKVPDCILRVKPEAYTPQLIILGPLHFGKHTSSVGYSNMEKYKKIYLAEFARRFEGEQTIDELRRIIQENEEKIRASYSHSTTWIISQKFVDMILHDSVFIIEFMLRTNGRRSEKTGDPLVDQPCLKNTIKEDLILLENQLPYYILEKLFEPLLSILLPNSTFRNLVIAYFVSQGQIRNNSKFSHFTDLFRLAYVETIPQANLKVYNGPKEHMYSAEKLNCGGVKFEAIDDEKFYLNVRFENGRLKMPCLKFDGKSEMRFRNIMALEQCHYPYNAYICNYVLFLDHLIDTQKDVEVLVEKGIIKNWIVEAESVAKIVNKLCWGIVEIGSYYYHSIEAEVNTYYRKPINKSRALLKRVYFSNLWTGTATLAATFLLLMTLIQTITSIMQVKQK